MSIIYEALKKVEKTQASLGTILSPQGKPQTPDKKDKATHWIFYTLIVILGFFIANALLGAFTKSQVAAIEKKPGLAQKLPVLPLVIAQAPPAVEAKKEALTEMILSGLFFSNDKGYVLINNRILKEGDQINNAVIKRITLDGVELQTKDSVIKLSNNR